MRKNILFLFLLITFLGFGQKSSLLKGKIIVDTLELEAVNIINLTKGTGTINNSLGYFKIKADPGDEIAFSSIQFQLKKHVVTSKDLQSDTFLVFLEPQVNQLDEVRISEYILSGDIQKDIQEIPTYEDRLPLWNAAQIKKMRIVWQDDAQSPVRNIALGGGNSQASISIDIGILVNLVSRAFKKRSKQIESTGEITDFYREEFFVEELKIPETEFYNFLDFIKEKSEIKVILKTKDELKILDFLMDQSEVFKKKYNID
ncbi:hypothetical protein SAMN04487910_2143 [Aquimarina amphilecti]|uniref:CarboxypepD_reg-like domain-containing protein n=1 Tax=Aquimarina amphilecti TaxID=1038014 RepID=A0A1H7NNG3_AQUAM|nr:hypothetical protein [Aquimarina amphilecti]SEL24555.1 hypothetical protein SAMN04487910_2143 [Aquimarina amphilecti]